MSFPPTGQQIHWSNSTFKRMRSIGTLVALAMSLFASDIISATDLEFVADETSDPFWALALLVVVISLSPSK
jgi:hypothetical protein